MGHANQTGPRFSRIYIQYRPRFDGDWLAVESWPRMNLAMDELQNRSGARSSYEGKRFSAPRTRYVDDYAMAVYEPAEPHELGDMTAQMRVWLRRAEDDVPDPSDAPDELWTLGPTGSLWRRKLREAGMPSESRHQTRGVLF